MDGFTLVDAGVALLIVISAVLAYSRGFVRESMAIAAWIAAAILGRMFAPAVQPLVKEIPVIGDFLADSCELSIIAAFFAVMAICLILFSLFTPLLSSIIQRSALGGLDQGLGFLFGVGRGVLLVGVALLVYDKAVAANTVPMVDDSRSAKIFANFQTRLEGAVPSDTPGWITEQYAAMSAVCQPAAQ